MPYQQDPNELGVLWIKSGAKGEYMTGKINGQPVVCFRNNHKTSEKAPDWRVMKPKQQDDEPRRDSQRRTFRTATDDDAWS